MIAGVDLSHWNDVPPAGGLDWKAAKAAGARFAILKASQGGAWVDNAYRTNRFEAARAGIAWGAYHYMDWQTPPETQAAHFALTVGSDIGTMGLWVDYEEQRDAPSDAPVRLLTMLYHIRKRTGIVAGVYTSPGFWNEHGANDKRFAEFPLWIAHYYVAQPIVPLPWNNWRMWQYTPKGSGSQYGVQSASVDLNWYNGDELPNGGSVSPAATTVDVSLRMTIVDGKVSKAEVIL